MGTLDRKKVRLNDQYFTPETDSFFVRGRVLAKGSPRPYFTGWVSRHRPDNIYGVRRFMDKDSARISFKETCDSEQLSRYPSLVKDWQKSRVYDWEGDFVYPHGKKIGRKQLDKLIERVCHDYKLEKPKVTWEKHTDHSWVFTDDNELHFGHRDTIGALHEMAHFVYESRRDSDESAPDHSPGFVWTAIELYARYADMDLSYLITSAAHYGVLGNIAVKDLPAQKKPGKSHGPQRQ